MIHPTQTKKLLEDILLEVSWAKIAKQYFGKSASWMYNKLSETDGNGNIGGFTKAEKEQLQGALYDLAQRIRKTADKLEQ
ncbi:DUF5053 domain-containing protein [Aequorivita sp. H23M31]|uniref:DUF5053 domain-containing protein n=2 Tax=Aequorivita ciconiae TaxID=2494375 RepID=A0A410G7F1_9FLAO|nr:DUF5053 domain-containing protein [Aequorivita sp. H23M31]